MSEREITLKGKTVLVPDDERFKIILWRNGRKTGKTLQFNRCNFGHKLDTGSINDMSACEAAMAHFDDKAREMLKKTPSIGKPRASDNMGPRDDEYKKYLDNAEAWRRIWLKVRAER